MANSLPSEGGHEPPGGSSLDQFGITLLRTGKRTLAGFAVLGLAIGASIGLLTSRQYASTAVFIPQTSDNAISGIELAASQFGIRVPQSGGAWGPPVYVELLQSRELLEPIVLDSIVVTERGSQRISVMDILRVPELPPGLRAERAIALLRQRVAISEEKKLNGVRVTVTANWPSVSLAVAERLINGVNAFNVTMRRSQATTEREFVGERVQAADRELRDSEARLQDFLKRNRSIAGSPELTFAQDRLQRDVTLRQSMLTTLLQKREEARIREVRDTPVISVLERPRLPVNGLAQRSGMKGVLGSLLSMLLGIAILFLREGLRLSVIEPHDSKLAAFRYIDAIFPPWVLRLLR